jgi:hypothetical protein
MEHLLTASKRDLADFDASVGNNPEASAGLAFFEKRSSGVEVTNPASLGQMT